MKLSGFFIALLVGVAAVPAAACELEANGQAVLPKASGLPATQVAGGIADHLATVPAFAGCSKEQLAAALMQANAWKTDTVLGDNPTVTAVRPKAASVAAPAPAAVPAEVAVRETELQQLQQKETELKREQSLNDRQLAAARNSGMDDVTAKLKADRRSIDSQLAGIRGRMARVEGEIAHLKAMFDPKSGSFFMKDAAIREGVISSLTTGENPFMREADVNRLIDAKLQATSPAAATPSAEQPAAKTDGETFKWFFDYWLAIIGLVVLAIIGGLIFLGRRSKRQSHNPYPFSGEVIEGNFSESPSRALRRVA